MSKQQIQHKL